MLVSATLALVVGLFSDRSQRDGMRLWALGLLVRALAYGLFALHGSVDEVWSVLAILPATSAAEGGLVLAEIVREALATTPVDAADAGVVPLTVSVGVAEVARDGAASTEAVIRAAELALYRAKMCGRNRVELAQAMDYAGGPVQRMRMPGTAPGQGSIT